MSAEPGAAWTCHARPAAANGATCGHVNATGGVLWRRTLVACEACGCTKAASDARKPKESNAKR